jgi:hypothetical protein
MTTKSWKWEPRGKTASERRAEWLKNPTHKIVPEFDPDRAARIAAEVPIDITPDWLKARSKIPVSCSTREYLQSIYQPQEKATTVAGTAHRLVMNRLRRARNSKIRC